MVRDVVLSGSKALTCLSCHRVRKLDDEAPAGAPGPICFDCHEAQGRGCRRRRMKSGAGCASDGVLSTSR
jgi:hypothetical protein